MNSALKPVLPQPGVPQPGGQASPAKGNVAGVNHSVGHPQGAQNSLHLGPNLVGQNLTHHPPTVPPPPAPLHAVPSMAPVSANMAQMAQNMSHHGNLSHVTQNSVAPIITTPSPSKTASTSAPLSLVQDKVGTSQPLALTRTPEKKDEPGNQANGTIESPKTPANAPSVLKPQNPEVNKDKQDIAKSSPSTPKPPEKMSSAPTTPQKPANAVGQADTPAQAKVVPANEAPAKSPEKPIELKPAPTADVAPSQSDCKPAPESANNSQDVSKQEKLPTPQKPVINNAVNAKPEPSPKVEDKKQDLKLEKPPQPVEKPLINAEKLSPNVPDKPSQNIPDKSSPNISDKPVLNAEKVVQSTPEQKKEVKEVAAEIPKKEDSASQPETKEVKETPEVKKADTPKPIPTKAEVKAPKSTLKLATVTTPLRKRRQTLENKPNDVLTPPKKAAPSNEESTPDSRTKRNRRQVKLYQSPTPELTMATKLSASAGRSTPTKQNDDKLILIYKNEYVAVRNFEESFYVCQAMQNVYRSTRKVKILWLSQDMKADPSGKTYKPDFYDVTDMECLITTLALTRAPCGGGAWLLPPEEETRAMSILERALKMEQGEKTATLELTEEHPDGLDISLYKDESQLDKKSRKRNSSKSSLNKSDASESATESSTPSKKARSMPKRSPRSVKATPSPKMVATNKRKSAGSTPLTAPSSKTATAVTEKPSPVKVAKSTPAKKPPVKPVKVETAKVTLTNVTPKGRRVAKDIKPIPIAPTPSTSTGKTTRTPRKPPSKK